VTGWRTLAGTGMVYQAIGCPPTDYKTVTIPSDSEMMRMYGFDQTLEQQDQGQKNLFWTDTN